MGERGKVIVLATVAGPLCCARDCQDRVCAGVILLRAFSFDRDITNIDAPKHPHTAATAPIAPNHSRIEPWNRSRCRMTRR